MGKSNNDAIIPQYLDLVDEQRETTFHAIEQLTEDQIWQRPEPGEWSIGEILNHTQLVSSSLLSMVSFLWRYFNWTTKLWPNRDYRTNIGDPYRKERVPMWVGFFWKPQHNPENSISFEALKAELRAQHQHIRNFYENKPESFLGNVFVFDPLFGFVNLILALRIGLYHDQLHYEDVIQMGKTF
jgi:hypothetical protein